MAETFTCDIVTPVSTVFSGEATYVGLPGEVGSFGVMRRHEPLVSALKSGVVSVTTPEAGKDGTIRFVLSGGYAQISDDKVIVLANEAVAINEIDSAKVKADLAKVEGVIAGLKDGDSSAAYYKGQKAWYELQLKAVSGE